ncbi:MAG: hypothetical protein JWM10_645 [Myxococcaceae bacterium]|nr:hypothetical protein [Myxococcaceae bacterium]
MLLHGHDGPTGGVFAQRPTRLVDEQEPDDYVPLPARQRASELSDDTSPPYSAQNVVVPWVCVQLPAESEQAAVADPSRAMRANWGAFMIDVPF